MCQSTRELQHYLSGRGMIQNCSCNYRTFSLKLYIRNQIEYNLTQLSREGRREQESGLPQPEAVQNEILVRGVPERNIHVIQRTQVFFHYVQNHENKIGRAPPHPIIDSNTKSREDNYKNVKIQQM